MNKPFPDWPRQRLPRPSEVNKMNSLLADLQLNTVCQSAACPNLGQCFSDGTATFQILGDICTRNCSFCAVKQGRPGPVDPNEPQRISEAVRRLRLEYVVVTSVTRDDLPDGGAAHFARTARAIRSHNSRVKVEVLIPDFQGSSETLGTLLRASPDTVGHNIETVPRLYPAITPGADYRRSLELLKRAKGMRPDVLTKSGMMLGLGERPEEVPDVMRDLKEMDCDILTIGQYLSPSPRHRVVDRWVTPEEFDDYTEAARRLGFRKVVCAPWVRSSYRAARTYLEAISNAPELPEALGVRR